jgi:hypothetical protein
MSRWFLLTCVVGVSSLSLLWSCDTSVEPGGADAGPSAECLEANDHSDLDWIQEKIFTPSCAAFSACHQGRALSAAGLNLEAGMAAENMIDVPSTLEEAEGMVMVKPGDPQNSYLAIILGQYPGNLPDSGTMPYNSPKLCQEKRDAIDRWIVSLAEE